MGYKKELNKLQAELCHLQHHIRNNNLRVVVLFEGRDAAGKGGAIRRITKRLDPNHYKVVAKGKPTEEENAQWYFQRWVKELPRDGEIIFLDRSWYTRCLVESVMGFSTKDQVSDFLNNVNRFERMLQSEGVIVIKYWLSIRQETQEVRFHQRLNDIRKQWKLSEMDLLSRSKWKEFTAAKQRMFKRSHTERCPWNIVDSNDKRVGRLTVMTHLLSLFDYSRLDLEPKTLPKIKHNREDKT